MSTIKKFFNSLIQNDKKTAEREFHRAMNEKLAAVKEIRKVALTSKIFNESQTQLDEAVSANEFVKGGNGKIVKSEVDDLLGDIYDSSSLTKSLVRNKAYQEGEDNPKKPNPYKKDTFDYHLYLLGQQIEQSRS